MKFGKKRKCLVAEFQRNQEKIMADELKMRRMLQEKMRKELENIEKAELKEQQKKRNQDEKGG